MVSANSIVFGNCTAITELAGRPASMKWAASAEIALVGLHKGQPLRRLAGDALLVGRIHQRQRVRLPREDAPEQDIEGRRCVGVGHGVGCVTLVA